VARLPRGGSARRVHLVELGACQLTPAGWQIAGGVVHELDAVLRPAEHHERRRRLAEHLLQPLASGIVGLDRDGAQVRRGLDEAAVGVGRRAAPVVIERKGRQHRAVGPEHRRGPAGGEIVLGGEFAKVAPERVGRDVLDDHRLSAVRSGAA
jgi:hypothetical protein